MEWILILVVVIGLAMVVQGSRASTAERKQRLMANRLADLERKVDAIAGHLGVTVPEPDNSDLVALLREGKRIQAVKLHREQSGFDLADSVAFIDELTRRNGI